MRKVLKNFFNLLIVIFLLNGCQSVKDGLTTNKNLEHHFPGTVLSI